MDLPFELWLLIKYLFLGLFQGFTEPIPISSSGHLLIVKDLMNIEIKGLSFEVLVNFGSLIAVLMVYRNDILRLLKNGTGYLMNKKSKENKTDFKFIIYLLIGTVPAAVIGLLFEDWISGTIGAGVKTIGITLIITGIALWIIRNIRGNKNDGDLTVKDAIIIGFAQAIALMPGISRSGATIVAAMLLGMKQETALRFSFLLYLPVSAGTLLLSLEEIITDPNISVLWIPYLFAFIGAVFATYYALRWFMNIMAQGNLKYFAIYCFIVGTVVYLLM